MASWVSAVCVLLFVTSSLAAAPPGSTPDASGVQHATTVNENFSFLNAIRKNLRRNNEDYVKRRANENLQQTVTEADKVTPFIGTATKTHLRIKTLLQNQQAPVLDGNDGQNKMNVIKSRNTNHRPINGNKWKRIVSKSKNLIQHVSSPRDMLNSSRQPGQLRTLRNTRNSRTRPIERAGSSLHDLFSKRTQGPNRDPPNADQLDMAPARGAFINDMRGKGQICHRHVLWPEGPKYDSQGNIIMPMYRPKLYDGKDFAQTSKPRFVLPRCCNCCKKSVLGCQ